MLILFQILFILFSVFALVSVIKKGEQGVLGRKGIAFWVLFWLVADVAVLWPDSTSILAHALGIGRGTDLIVYISVAVMFYVLFRLHVKIEEIGRDVTRVVRKEALEKKK